MTAPKVETSLRFSPDPSDLDRNHRKYMNTAHREAADLHHRKFMKRHFDYSAYRLYGYQSRGKKYNERKKRLFGHTLPNVFTGKSRREITTQRQITATPSGARLIMRLPIQGGSGRVLDEKALKRLGRGALTKHQIHGQQLILTRVAEMETVSEDEVQAFAKNVERSYGLQADAAGRPRVVTFK